MALFYDSLKALISPEMARRAAKVLDEKEANVSKASSSIISSLMGVMLKNGNTPQIRNILEEAGNLDILSDIGNICEERPTQEQQRIGDSFLQNLLGDKAADFTAPIAKQDGLSKVATNRLIAIIAPVFAGYFGNKLVKDGWSLHKLLNEINNQKASFSKMIPADLVRAFGLGSVLNAANTKTTNDPAQPEKKKNNSWITWLIIIIIILLIIFLWRSCRNRTPDTAYVNTTTYMTDTVRNNQMPVTRSVPVTRGTQMTDTTMARQTTQITLANGTRITAYRNGVEQEMIDFLESDNYRNATEQQLQDKWFQFDNIAFEFGSATQLKEGSRDQLNNIVSILRAYPNSRIKIAGFADKRGTENANMRISQERAKSIENMFEQAGVGSQVVRTEGYGDEYAKHSANAPESERAEDRDIALRFVKQGTNNTSRR